jgi:hypothetical protein
MMFKTSINSIHQVELLNIWYTQFVVYWYSINGSTCTAVDGLERWYSSYYSISILYNYYYIFPSLLDWLSRITVAR